MAEATPAQRVALGIWLTLIYSGNYLLLLVGALFNEHVSAALNMPVAYFFITVIVVVCGFELMLLRWLRKRMHSPEPLPRVYLMLAIMVALPYTLSAMLPGNYTYPTNLVVIGLVPVGLLLLDVRSTVVALGLGLSCLFFHDLAVLNDIVAYGTLFKPEAYQNPAVAGIFEAVRSYLLYINLAGYGTLIYALFAQYDDQERRLVELSQRDGLTGLSNRRYFFERLEQELANQSRSGDRLCVVMLDADYFKRVNDTYGHMVGDQVLTQIAQVMDSLMRVPSDLPARIGGEEFAILLPNTDLSGARALCERLHKALAVHEFIAGDKSFRVTVSMGIACSRMSSVGELIREADANLYRAKAAGRDTTKGSNVGPRAAEEVGVDRPKSLA